MNDELIPVPRDVLDAAIARLQDEDAESAPAQALADWIARHDGQPVSDPM